MSYEEGTEIGGKYTIEREIGEGGIAVVYKVSHNRLKISRALKVLKISHPKLRERLAKEAELQAQMSHPNVVSVLDVVEVDGCPGLILEYIDGMALDEWLEMYTPTIEQAKNIFLEILDALEEAHDRGIIHRDLKPSNIMMQRTRRAWVAKVCDFGLAKALEENNSSMTRTGVTMGTPAYMAPEQIRDSKNVDQRADIFSLGAIFYEVLTGEQAFQGNDTLELLNSVAKVPHTPLQVYVQNVPPSFEQAIDGALTKDADERIPNCEMLRSILLGEKVWGIDHNSTIEGIDLVGVKEPKKVDLSNPDSLHSGELQRLNPFDPVASFTPIPPEELHALKSGETVESAESMDSISPTSESKDPLPLKDSLTDFENELEQFESSYDATDPHGARDFNIQPSGEFGNFEDSDEPEKKSSMMTLLILLAISGLIFAYLNKDFFSPPEEPLKEEEIKAPPEIKVPKEEPKVEEKTPKKKTKNKKRTPNKKQTSKKNSGSKPKATTDTSKKNPPAEKPSPEKNDVAAKPEAKEVNAIAPETEKEHPPEEKNNTTQPEEIDSKITPEKKENERILPGGFDKEVREQRKEAIKSALAELDKVEDGVLDAGNVIFTTAPNVDDYYLKGKDGKKYQTEAVPVGTYKLMISCGNEISLLRMVEIKKGKLTHLACTCEPSPKCMGR